MGVERLGRYTVLRHLASGGMADVLLARADGEAHQIAGFERHVVVKRIKAEHAKDKRFIQMFLDEARLAATLHHQNVVQVHDIGEEHGEYFFAMEYLHGEDLRRILSTVSKQRQHIPLHHVLAIISASAAGLHYAHERRDNTKKRLDIVHRDVSPSNIVLGYDGSVKVLDFGIAKAAMRTSETRTGTLKGKVSYMSPEQCKGVQVVDRRSDVYSLGVVFYELATTSRLFKAESDYLVQDAIVNGKVPLPRIRRSDLPNELSSIILRALAVDPARRYQTAEELGNAVDEFAASAQLQGNASSLATYMKKLFGEKPEPWQDATGQVELIEAQVSWNDLAAADMTVTGDGDQTALSEPPTTANRKPTVPPLLASGPSASGPSASGRSTSGKMITPSSALAAATRAELGRAKRPSSINDTRTSTRMAWQYDGDAPQAQPSGDMKLSTKIALMLGPVALVAGGLVVMRMMDSSSQNARPPIVTTPTTPTTTPTPTTEPMPAPVAVTAEVPTSTPTLTTKLPTTAPAARPPTVAPTPAATPALIPVSPALAPALSPAPTPVPADPPTLTPGPTPAPETPAAMAQLAPATVSLVAGDHAAQLSKCEGTDALHGDVAITFEINAAGRVVSSQLNSTIHNIKIAACILSAVKTWQFPKPPSGAAKGVYTISYQ